MIDNAIVERLQLSDSVGYIINFVTIRVFSHKTIHQPNHRFGEKKI